MTIKILLSIFLMVGIKLLYNFYNSNVDAEASETSIDKAWWDQLSEEWKSILLINQSFNKQRTDIYAVQNEYMNRMKLENEDDYSEMNTSLHKLNSDRAFGLTYDQFYARAIKFQFVTSNDRIHLETLGNLEMIYMVGGPGDLTPLKKFPNLKILILNFCGVPNANRAPALDLEPLRNLKKLQVLECNAHLVHSIEAIKNLTALRELRIESTEVTDLSPLKKLVNLEVLTVRTKAKNVSAISNLVNLKILQMDGLQKVPNLSKLIKLESLSIGEDEMALVNSSYQIKSIDFLSNLKNLKYLDLEITSYKGDLTLLNSLQNLKAITLPPVNSAAMLNFKKNHSSCVIINAYKYE